MAQANMNLKGWKALLAIVLVLGLGVVRFITFQDKTNDATLMRDVKRQIMSDYMPKEVARLQSAVDSGDRNNIAQTTDSVAGAKPKIESVQVSSPLLEFSMPQDVVVKVVYSMVEGSKTRDREILYFLYTHNAIGNTWICRYKTTALSYYLNFK